MDGHIHISGSDYNGYIMTHHFQNDDESFPFEYIKDD